MFTRIYFIKRGFLDGRHGLVLASLYAYYTFLKYAKLWEMQNSRAMNPSTRPLGNPAPKP